MKYIFCDAVWYQKTSCFEVTETQLLAVNLIETDERFHQEDKVGKRIYTKQLTQMSDQVLNYLREDRYLLEQGEPEREVLEFLVHILEEKSVLVVWKRRTYDVLLQAMNRHQILLKEYRVIVLQELLSVIDPIQKDKRMNFMRELQRYHVHYQMEQLYDSSYKVVYLKKLYCSAKYYYKQECIKTPEKVPIRRNSTGMLHESNCSCIRSIKEKSAVQQTLIGIWEGEPICKKCIQRRAFEVMPESIQFKRIDRVAEIERYVKELCKRLGLQCTFATGIIFVKSNYTSWRIYHHEGEIEKVCHENYRNYICSGRKSNGKFEYGFHLQEVKITSFKEIILYIAKHDSSFLSRI